MFLKKFTKGLAVFKTVARFGPIFAKKKLGFDKSGLM